MFIFSGFSFPASNLPLLLLAAAFFLGKGLRMTFSWRRKPDFFRAASVVALELCLTVTGFPFGTAG
jgi:hypothetical protein